MEIETRGIILSRQRTTKALIRLLFVYGINRFYHDLAHLRWVFDDNFSTVLHNGTPYNGGNSNEYPKHMFLWRNKSLILSVSLREVFQITLCNFNGMIQIQW